MVQLHRAVSGRLNEYAPLEVTTPAPQHLTGVVDEWLGVRCGDDRMVHHDDENAVGSDSGGDLFEELAVVGDQVEQTDGDHLVDRAGPHPRQVRQPASDHRGMLGGGDEELVRQVDADRMVAQQAKCLAVTATEVEGSSSGWFDERPDDIEHLVGISGAILGRGDPPLGDVVPVVAHCASSAAFRLAIVVSHARCRLSRRPSMVPG